MSDTATPGTEGTEAPHGTETDGASAETETPTVEELLAKVEELTGHSRKWEDRAKANKEKADAFEAAQREKMTDAEKAQAELADHITRAETAEKRAEDAEAALARLSLVHEFGLADEDVKALDGITNPDTLRALAERLAGRSGPKPDPSQGRRSRTPKPGNPADAFVAALEGLL